MISKNVAASRRTDPTAPPKPDPVPELAETHLRWNFSVNLVERMFSTLGMSMISATTILPLLVSELTPSRVIVGLVPALFAVGTMTPQLLTASYTESLPYKRPFISGWAMLGGRLPYLVAGILVWQLAIPQPTLTLTALLMLITLAAFSNGIVIPAWLDMIAKVIPQRVRGIFFGAGNGVGALMGVLGGIVAGQILETRAFPTNFALCFALAFAVQTISWMGVTATREPPTRTPKPRIPITAYLRQLPTILRTDPNYARYLASRAVAALGGMGSSFMIVYARETYAITGSQVGTLTAILIGSQAVTNLFWGYLGDRIGHKSVLALGEVSIGLASVAIWAGNAYSWLIISFIMLGAGLAANAVSGINIVLEFGHAEDRPTYIGLTNTSLAPITMLAPVVGGAISEGAGFTILFALAAAFAALGAALLGFWFRDPRSLAANRAPQGRVTPSP
jgi:MFS family permease